MTGVVRIIRPSPAEVAGLRVLAPLAAELTIRCGPFDVPAALTASVPTLEHEVSEEAQMARDFINMDPYNGMGSVYPGGWMLLARDDDTVVIGQREGRVGLGTVVQLERRDGAFGARGMSGWELQPSDTSRRIEACFTARTRGTTVTVDWTNGEGLDGAPSRVDPCIELVETPEDVHFLLHTASGRRPRAGSAWIAGTATPATASFELTAPLGSRRLLNDQGIPPVIVTTTAG